MCFTKLLSKVLPLKRGVLAGDRIVKFCYLFVNGLVKDANEEKRSKRRRRKDKDKDKDTNESDKMKKIRKIKKEKEIKKLQFRNSYHI